MAGSILASPTADAAIAGISRARHVSPGMEAWRRFRRHRLAVMSIVILGLMMLAVAAGPRSEEHTSELQSHLNLVCRLLLEKKKKTPTILDASYLVMTDC